MNDYFFDDSLSFLADNYPDYFYQHRIDMKMNDSKVVDYLKLIFPDIVDLTHTSSKHDFILPEKNDGGEIKVRRRHYEDWGIEKHKYDHLKENNFSLYVVWSPGDRTIKDIRQGHYYPKMYMWNINEIQEPEWVVKPGPTSTDYAHHQEIMEVDKVFGFLDPKDSIELTHLLYQ